MSLTDQSTILLGIFFYPRHNYARPFILCDGKSFRVQYLVLVDTVAMTQIPDESNEMRFETEVRVGVGVSAPCPRQGEIVCCGEHIFT